MLDLQLDDHQLLQNTVERIFPSHTERNAVGIVDIKELGNETVQLYQLPDDMEVTTTCIAEEVSFLTGIAARAGAVRRHGQRLSVVSGRIASANFSRKAIVWGSRTVPEAPIIVEGLWYPGPTEVYEPALTDSIIGGKSSTDSFYPVSQHPEPIAASTQVLDVIEHVRTHGKPIV